MDLGSGLSGEQAPELDREELDEGEGKDSQDQAAEADKANPPAEGDKPPEPKTETPAKKEPGPLAEGNIRDELVKRYGERSDQELLTELFKSYRNIENEFGKTTGEVKELKGIVEQFGGVDALKKALTEPPPSDEQKPAYSPRIQKLIDSGHLDPEDPKDALIIEQDAELQRSRQASEKTVYNETVQKFENGLKEIATKFEYADLDTIRGMAYGGAFTGLDGEQFWGAVRGIAEKQHNRVLELADGKTQAQLNQLKELGKKGLKTGSPAAGKPEKGKPQDVFNAEYDKHFGS